MGELDELFEQLIDEHWKVRVSAIDSLGKLKDKRAVEPLIQTLKDENVDVKKSAVYALGEILDERAIKPLQEIMVDNKDHFGLEAAKALIKLVNHFVNYSIDLKSIKKFLESNKEEDRFYAIRVLLEVHALAALHESTERLIEYSHSLKPDLVYDYVIQPLLNNFDCMLYYMQETYFAEYYWFSHYLPDILEALSITDLHKEKIIDHILQHPVINQGIINVTLEHVEFETQEFDLLRSVLIGIAIIASRLRDRRMVEPLIKSLLKCNELAFNHPSEYVLSECYWNSIQALTVFKAIRNSDSDKAEELTEMLLDQVNDKKDSKDSTLNLLFYICTLGNEKVLTTLESWLEKNPDWHKEQLIRIGRMEAFVSKNNLNQLKDIGEELLSNFECPEYVTDGKDVFNKILRIREFDKSTKLEFLQLLEGIFYPLELEKALEELHRLEKDEEVKSMIEKVQDSYIACWGKSKGVL